MFFIAYAFIAYVLIAYAFIVYAFIVYASIVYAFIVYAFIVYIRTHVSFTYNKCLLTQISQVSTSLCDSVSNLDVHVRVRKGVRTSLTRIRARVNTRFHQKLGQEWPPFMEEKIYINPEASGAFRSLSTRSPLCMKPKRLL
jgi:hypothetical protein